MPEYIERDMLLKIISHKPSSPTTDREDRLINYCISAVKNFPAADVVEVVRCRACIFRSSEWTGCPKLNGTITGDEFFCAAGKKRAET